MNLDIAYSNADFIPGAMDYPPRWAAAAEDFRQRMAAAGKARLGVAYGRGERNAYDLFLPQSAPRGLVVYIHGGYWRAFHRNDWSHFATGPLLRGWAVAMPSYTLAPTIRIAAITREVAAAITAAAAEFEGPVVLTGHSAGGHLTARMNCADVDLPDELTARIKRLVPISPLSDMRPLMQTAMNADFRLDAAEAAAESPILHARRRNLPTVVWVGAEERPAFLDQARWLVQAWPEGKLRIAPGRHHFDVIDDLALPDSPLTNALLAGL
jgi:arylformamidase